MECLEKQFPELQTAPFISARYTLGDGVVVVEVSILLIILLFVQEKGGYRFVNKL